MAIINGEDDEEDNDSVSQELNQEGETAQHADLNKQSHIPKAAIINEGQLESSKTVEDTLPTSEKGTISMSMIGEANGGNPIIFSGTCRGYPNFYWGESEFDRRPVD